VSLTRVIRVLALGVVVVLGRAPALQGQDSRPDSLLAVLANTQRAQVSRVELERSLAEIERLLATDGYSSALRDRKRVEADQIRQRLATGDIRPGDVIVLAVANEPSLTGAFTVTTNRSIILPGAGEIAVGPILRSEVEEFMRTQVRRFVRDPIVRADAQIRVSIFGGVNRPGFYVAPASMLLPDLIMQSAGGVSGTTKLEKSEIRRDGRVLLSREAFQAAIREGKSLDQLNIQAGDEIHVGQRRLGPVPILTALSVVTSLSFIILRVF
jgi:protein involved in polysaccharide export with SLBB domain